ncbi:NETI motif-containing protein [Bacillus sp. T33-2]|uniref:NETI motif-containing protein n=1 Tax=Bacillus sp. T33-2 TaxID=2054168 RepID=UPI000C78271C|nr:NETI motif-containing protein [Bacillus sp. T33-2]PLR99196.1 NETI motif-containing protein [Bacillus sp. T33-2]
MSKPKKKIFEVLDNETIDDCLDRIKKEGYIPVRRMEKPIFKEMINDGSLEYEPAGRQIVFEAKLDMN